MISSRIQSIKDWSQDVGGNALMIFAFALPALFGSAGLAVDFSRIQSAKTAALATMDAALLAASRTQTLNDSTVDGLVQAYFNKPGALKHGGRYPRTRRWTSRSCTRPRS